MREVLQVDSLPVCVECGRPMTEIGAANRTRRLWSCTTPTCAARDVPRIRGDREACLGVEIRLGAP